ncbi:MAG: hypothetical protein R3B90_23350 [Planctomycetaceae bacterium]
MSTAAAIDDLRLRILSSYPLLILRTYEEQRWEELLADLALELERGLVTWSVTGGARPPMGGDGAPPDPLQFLEQIERYPSDHLFLLKDLHPVSGRASGGTELRDMLGATGWREAER